MANSHNTAFVSQVTFGDGTKYYLCSSTRISSIGLDSDVYNPFIIDIGDAEKIGNFGEGSSFGKCSMRLLLGQEQYQGDYNLDIKKSWNNSTCTIKICDSDSNSTWVSCESYHNGVIKNFKIENNSIQFDVEDTNQKDNKILPQYTAESYVDELTTLETTDIPEDSRGKYIPMQFGDLTTISQGQFGKGLLINNKIGFQRIQFDSSALHTLNSIGMWENGSKRYFTGKASGEYSIESVSKNYIEFKVDSSASLLENMIVTTGIETINIAGGLNLVWKTEDDFEQIDNYPEILGINIIAIDSELMLLVEQPSDNIMIIERGYAGTTVSTHAIGSKIYQSAKFSARNLLSFSETFYPIAVSNNYHSPTLSTHQEIISGTWSNFIDTDNSNYIKLASSLLGFPWDHTNVDLRFANIEDKFTVYSVYHLIKMYSDLYDWGYYVNVLISVSSESTIYNSVYEFEYPDEVVHFTFRGNNNFIHARNQILLDTIATPTRDGYSTADFKQAYYPDLLTAGEIIGSQPLVFTELSDLNNKWKLHISISKGILSDENYIQLYRTAFLIDFFADFTNRRTIGSLYGRKITATVDTICGTALVGGVAQKPWHILALILTDELGYTSSDFDTTSWQAVENYYSTFEEVPVCAFSYGIDEKEKGWDLCQDLSAQYNLTLTKTDSGKIKIINLLKLQDTTVNGYSSLTTYQVSIDDIIISGGKRSISIQQTGTDRIRNVVKINYNRNNSTDEYQNSFPGGEQGITNAWLDTNHLMPESGISLSTARTNYYGGQKTEDLEINAWAIYNYTAAYRLWKWHINDKAEVFFYISITIPYYHYSDVNSKTSQYDIGDVIYLDGIYQGITFGSSHKFVIRNISKIDNGKEIRIEAKSIEPVSEF